MASNATRPDFFSKFESLAKKTADEKGLTDEEIHLSTLSQQKGWKILTDTKDALLQEFDRLNEQAIATGMSYEEIGKNTLVISLAKGAITRLWNKVDDANEAYERTTSRTGEK
jgi:hypothetical protein